MNSLHCLCVYVLPKRNSAQLPYFKFYLSWIHSFQNSMLDKTVYKL